MADYVDSEMNVYGKRKDLIIFKEDVLGEDDSALDFNKIVPMPEDVSAWDKKRKGDGWYYWQLEHWGVKWGVHYSSVIGESVAGNGHPEPAVEMRSKSSSPKK